jgi:hypothetical protein
MGARGRRRAVSSVLALTWLTLITPEVRAQTANDIPPECGTRAAFDAELRERLGADAPVDSVHVSIAPRSRGHHLQVTIGAERRELDDDSCAELFRAAVVIAVAMLMHDRTAPQAPPSQAPPSPPEQPARRPERPRFALGAGAGINVGTLPRATPSFELEAQVLWQRWGAAFGARYLLRAEKLVDDARGATVQAVGGHAALIFRPSRDWQARLGFAAQLLLGDGQGSAKPQSAQVWAAGPTLGLGFVPYEFGPAWLGLGAEGQLNAVRGEFKILNYNREVDHAVHSVPWLAGSGFVRFGLVW